jgi:hypothetical protein
MKLLARIVFLLLTIGSGLWVLNSVPQLIASFKRPDDVAASIGAITFPFLLFVAVLFCWVKLRPTADDGNSAIRLTTTTQSRGSKIGKMVAVIILGALIAFFAYAGIKSARNPSPSKYVKRTELRGANWATRTLKDLTLESPWELSVAANRDSNPAGTHPEKTEYAESYDSTSSSKEFYVGVGRIGFKPGIAADLDTATEGLMKGILRSAKNAGDANPALDVRLAKSGNLPARTFSYAGKTTSNRLRVDGIYIQDGQKMWYVIVVYQSDFLAADAVRVIHSVRVSSN